jgi:hypothetical protein
LRTERGREGEREKRRERERKRGKEKRTDERTVQMKRNEQYTNEMNSDRGGKN